MVGCHSKSNQAKRDRQPLQNVHLGIGMALHVHINMLNHRTQELKVYVASSQRLTKEGLGPRLSSR